MQSCLLSFCYARCLNLSLCPIPQCTRTMGCNGSTRGLLNISRRGMGGDTEDVAVRVLPSVWAYAAYVLVSLFCKCRKKRHITSDLFSNNFPVYCRNDNTGIVAFLPFISRMWTKQSCCLASPVRTPSTCTANKILGGCLCVKPWNLLCHPPSCPPSIMSHLCLLPKSWR